MIAAKHFDPVVGVDIHIIQPPGPVPPVPVPHPFVGMLIDPTEYAPIIGGTVKINGMMRGVAGTGGKAIPPHIPIGGVFVMPPGNECEMFMGSATVAIDGDPQSRLGDPVLSCQSVGMPSIPRLKMHARPKTLMLPTSVVLAVPMGPPVLVGGPPTISLSGMAMKFGMAALGRVMRRLRALQRGSRRWAAVSDRMRRAADRLLDRVPGGNRLRGMAHNAICSLTGHPVDVASGKVTTESTDVELPGPLPFKFSRMWYSQSDYQGPLGHGWHHSYDLGLYRFPEGVVVRLADGRFVVFQPPVPGEPSFDRTEKLFLHLTDRGYHAETLDGLVYHFGWPSRDGNELPLDHVRDSNGNRILLERVGGKLVAFVDCGGRRLPVVTDTAGRITEIRVPDPEKPGDTYPMVTYRYDRRGDLVQADDALGNPFKYEYLEHLLVRETDRSGLAFYFMYDGSGPDAKCLRTWGDGNLFLRDLSYDSARQRTEVTNSLGHKTVYEWNDAGLVVKETDPLGGATLTEWSPFNDRLSRTNQNGAKTEFVYDELGRLAGVIDPTGAAVAYEYDAAGNQVAFTDPNGSVWKREYDDRRNVVAVTDPLGHRRTFQVNDRGLPVTATDPLGRTTVYEWSPAGLLTRLTDRGGGVRRTEFDTLGRAVGRTDQLGRPTRIRYDRLDRPVASAGAAGTTTLRYDAGGNPREVCDQAGRVTRYTFRAGRLEELQTPAGRTTRYRYDTEGDLTAATDAAGRTWQFTRDGNGRVLEERPSDGRVLRYQYDPVGRLIGSQNARGQWVRLKRDPAGRLVSRVLPDEAVETFAYDPAGRMLAATNRAAKVEWVYDRLGRVLVERVNGRAVRSEYDPAGNRTRRESPLGHRVSFDYDPDGRLVALGAGGREVFRSTLDPLGREQSRRTPDGSVSWEWERRPTGELTEVRVRAGEAIDRRYEYDVAGFLSAQQDDRFGRWEYHHDADGHLMSAVGPDGDARQFARDRAGDVIPPTEVRLTRDADGNVVGRETGGGGWRYEYDPLGRLVGGESDTGWRVKYEYDPLGRRVKAVGATTTEYLWDGDLALGEVGPERVEYVFRPRSFEPLARLAADGPAVLDCDPVGLPRTAVGPDGRVHWRATFEPYGRVLAEEGKVGFVSLRYPGQVADADTGLIYNRFRYLDPDVAAYTSPDPLGLFAGGGVWDYAASPVQWCDPYGLADCASRSAAFRQAKRDLGIPQGQRPDRVRHVPLTESDGSWIMGPNGRPVMTREYDFTRADGSKVVIQEHSLGHQFGEGGVGDQGPHFNVRPAENTRTGSVPGSDDHYSF